MDWIVLLIIGLLVFLAWHVTTSPHPEGRRPELPPDPTQRRPASVPQKSGGGGGVQKAMTIFAEPGLSGQVIDPMPTTRQVPAEAPMFSSLAMPF